MTLGTGPQTEEIGNGRLESPVEAVGRRVAAVLMTAQHHLKQSWRGRPSTPWESVIIEHEMDLADDPGSRAYVALLLQALGRGHQIRL